MPVLICIFPVSYMIPVDTVVNMWTNFFSHHRMANMLSVQADSHSPLFRLLLTGIPFRLDLTVPQRSCTFVNYLSGCSQFNHFIIQICCGASINNKIENICTLDITDFKKLNSKTFCWAFIDADVLERTKHSYLNSNVSTTKRSFSMSQHYRYSRNANYKVTPKNDLYEKPVQCRLLDLLTNNCFSTSPIKIHAARKQYISCTSVSVHLSVRSSFITFA